MKAAMFLLSAAGAWAQSGLGTPFTGQMIDAQGSLRPVYGLSGNFTLGGAIAQRVLASACSQALCLAKTESSLVWPGGATSAPPGAAEIALDATGATVHFDRTGEFARWQNGSLTQIDLRVDGVVLSMASTSAGLLIAVERDGTIWIISQDGAILDSLPEDASAVLLLPALTVYARQDSLVIRKPDGGELRFPAPGAGGLTAMGNGYVEARAGSTIYALRTVSGREQLFQLPAFQLKAAGESR